MIDALDSAISPRRPATYFFFGLWAVITVVLAAWIMTNQPLRFDTGIGFPAMVGGLVLSLAFFQWLPGPALEAAAGGERAGQRWLVAAALGAAGVLFACAALFGRRLLYGIPVLAVLILLVLRAWPARREIVYGLALAVVATVAGLGMGHVQYISPVAWAVLQLPVVSLSLLAGWALLRRSGLWQAGLGRSLLLANGPRRALRGAGLGMLLAIPWALVNVTMGGAQQDVRWATSPFHALAALQPGIAEESWGRLFLVTLLVVLLDRGRPASRPAVLTAVLIAGSWFSYLHVISDPNPAYQVISTLVMTVLFALPMALLWLRRGLETAMGFHFLIDAVRFGMAYLVGVGILKG